MTPTPSLVILSTHGKDGRDVVKGILDKECLPEPSSVVDGVECWEWWVENKYYTATVQLACVSQPEQCLPWILENGEALIIYCDSAQNDVLERVNSLLEKTEDFEPEVQLLVCDALAEDDNTDTLSTLKGQQWCISNGWELVELHPHQPQAEDPEEDDFHESWGFKRICQALHAYTWSNLTMKDSQGNRLSAVLQSVSSQEDKSASSPQEGEEVMYSRLDNLALEESASNPPDEELENALDPSMIRDCLGEDGDFENLFSSFEHLKRTAANLPPNQRRDYAEKVAVAFWRAMGGDEDEVDGLGLDSD